MASNFFATNYTFYHAHGIPTDIHTPMSDIWRKYYLNTKAYTPTHTHEKVNIINGKSRDEEWEMLFATH